LNVLFRHYPGPGQGNQFFFCVPNKFAIKGTRSHKAPCIAHRKDRREGEDLRQCGGTRPAAWKDEVYQPSYLRPWPKKADENTEEDRAKRKKKAAKKAVERIRIFNEGTLYFSATF
jgi:hypothetical protein